MLAILLVGVLNSCGLFGIHFNVHNPKNPGKYPKFKKEVLLLGELTSIRDNFDVTYYDLELHIDTEEKTIGGWVQIFSVAKTSIDSIQIDLDSQFDISELRIASRSGESLSYHREERAVFIQLKESLNSEDTFSIHVQYSGKPMVAKKAPWDGGTIWKKDKNKRPWCGVACELEGPSVWFPCKDHTSDEADSARMRFSTPDMQKVISNGKYIDSRYTKDGYLQHEWRVSYPIDTYNITYYIGNYKLVHDSYKSIAGNTVDLNHYVLSGNEGTAKRHFQQVKRHIRAYEELYGPYPWKDDGFKLVESPYAGMEHQSAIAYGNGYANDLVADDYIILHETGHEWFGNSVSVDDLADVWLQEGITTYGEALYMEKTYGKDEYLFHLLDQRIFIQNKFPLVGPRNKRYFDYKDQDVYNKGSWVMHSLRYIINDDSLFFDCLKTFYQDYALITTNSDKFAGSINQSTGEDYTWFFDQYLYENKVPFLEYELAEDGTFYYRWVDAIETFNKVPVFVDFYISPNKVKLIPNSSIQTFKLNRKHGVPSSVLISNTDFLFGMKENKKLHKLLEK